jgi:hypothetical protein
MKREALRKEGKPNGSSARSQNAQRVTGPEKAFDAESGMLVDRDGDLGPQAAEHHAEGAKEDGAFAGTAVVGSVEVV